LAIVGWYCIAHGVPVWDTLYYECPFNESAGCSNPYYLACDEKFCAGIEFKERFLPGETVGEKPNAALMKVIYGAQVLAWVFFMLAILLNHLLYNKGKKPFKVEVE
jgi:hypothetical protein